MRATRGGEVYSPPRVARKKAVATRSWSRFPEGVRSCRLDSILKTLSICILETVGLGGWRLTAAVGGSGAGVRFPVKPFEADKHCSLHEAQRPASWIDCVGL